MIFPPSSLIHFKIITITWKIAPAPIERKITAENGEYANPPEAVVIRNDGTYGKILFENESVVIDEIEKEMGNIEQQITNSHISTLKPKQW